MKVFEIVNSNDLKPPKEAILRLSLQLQMLCSMLYTLMRFAQKNVKNAQTKRICQRLFTVQRNAEENRHFVSHRELPNLGKESAINLQDFMVS